MATSVATARTVTVALATTAPLESTTRPVSEALLIVSWANPGVTAKEMINKSAQRIRYMFVLLGHKGCDTPAAVPALLFVREMAGRRS